MLRIAAGGEVSAETHGDRTGGDLGQPRHTMMWALETAPESPAASANGTVRPSDRPMTTSRTDSLDSKCPRRVPRLGRNGNVMHGGSLPKSGARRP